MPSREMATFGIVLPLNVCPSGRSILKVMTGTAAAGGSSFQTSAPPAAMLRSTTAAINNAVLKRERGDEVDALKDGSVSKNFVTEMSAIRFARSFARHP